MTGGTGQDAPDTRASAPRASAPRASAPRASAPVVLDDSNYQIPDEWGLKEAYNDPESVVHHSDTLYIAGTHSLRDAVDDLLIPLHLVRNSQRYQQALAALQRANGRIKYLSGHSLGGAVAAVLQEDAIAGNLGPKYRGFREVRTYGAPLLHSDHIPNLHAYRRGWDPISAFDSGAATTSAPSWNPHSYAGYNRTSAVRPISGDRRSNVFVM